ncbi:hypothetical protein ASU64_06170 [Enterobacter hormaechei subsp. hoffmannii]|uniref:Uncharacterized protein n=1 Tax=Enterobacter hormaechei TaxID=158836 RepID=A0A9X7Q541_9ENTR|nr:hypothetical protein ASU64_06170 [Enterobacter hormaechei subsp. hoffmannii]PXB39482.1 hypothetical protein DL189_16180 [Enterobacter hormaechei]
MQTTKRLKIKIWKNNIRCWWFKFFTQYFSYEINIICNYINYSLIKLLKFKIVQCFSLKGNKFLFLSYFFAKKRFYCALYFFMPSGLTIILDE